MSDIQEPLRASFLHSDALPTAHGGALSNGRIRSQPEDFIVREDLGFVASGEGEHVLLTIRKRSANTKWVAKQIAARAGVRVREVGFAGLKDRHALTEQSFTVRSKESPAVWQGFQGEGFEVVTAARQRRKLRLGAHRGNRFALTVRDFDVDGVQLHERLTAIAQFGVPNYFGEQRFGRKDGNLAVAERWLCQGVLPADRDERSFALSAARSALFNEVLARRVCNGTWNRLLPGEVINLEGTGSVFVANIPDDALTLRCEQLDVHPTGPLCGIGDSRVQTEVAELEAQALASWSVWRTGLERLNVQQQRRALRLTVTELEWSYSASTLRIGFRLTRGAFATAVLREIVATSDAEVKVGAGGVSTSPAETAKIK
jgi:tRNA pseudouridine13 synthase